MRHSSRAPLTVAATVSTVALLSALALAAPTSSASGAPPSKGQACLAAVHPGTPETLRERVFAAAASTYGVPAAVAKGVSYLESRWDDHGSAPSTAGGYGPMHLTDLTPPDMSRARGKGTPIHSAGPAGLHTAQAASTLTGISLARVKTDSTANVCAGVALLASYQQRLGRQTGAHSPLAQWVAAVRQYSGSASSADSSTFARRVFTVIKSGQSRVTNDGQRVSLSAVPGLRIPAQVAPQTAPVDCPDVLACEWVPAPYNWYGRPDPYAYGNHDLANRPDGPNIRYIVIHDTEATYNTTLDLVQDPTYVSWNYTIRSSDGHVAQHTYANDVAWHAGNWYVNMHSIGIEHEGFAADGATWYTESMYESSATLVKYLAGEYNVPLDRAHIIGHDQVPGILPQYVKGMHWDPGPYWDWRHYFYLLGVQLGRGVRATPENAQAGDVVQVAPNFATNEHKVTGCVAPGVRCPDQGTNFVYLRVAPHRLAHLVRDIGIHHHGYSTTEVADIGARAATGQKMVVAGTAGNWIAVWWLGEKGWIFIPPGHSPLIHTTGDTIRAVQGLPVHVYGRAYPEKSAYPATIPYQKVAPLRYKILPGQQYVLADDKITTDYYYATTYDDSAPDDHTDVVGEDPYYEIWLGHRLAFVRTADLGGGQ